MYCFHSCTNKTNVQIKSFALGLAFVMRFKETRKCPNEAGCGGGGDGSTMRSDSVASFLYQTTDNCSVITCDFTQARGSPGGNRNTESGLGQAESRA